MTNSKLKIDNTDNKTVKIIIIILSALMLISILPEIVLSLFTYPLPGDDYGNAVYAKAAWEESHQISAVLSSAITRTIDIYKSWQGSLSGVFLMALNPLTISIGFYRAVMLLINLLFVFGVGLFAHTFFYNKLKVKRYISMFLAGIILFVSYHFVPHPLEAFYWYIGSSYYFMTFALVLIFFSMINILNQNLDRKAKRVIIMILLSLLAIFFGVNNLPNAVMLFCMLIIMCIYNIYKKNEISKYLIIITVIFLASFAVNISAPGNFNRGTVQGSDSLSFLGTIFHSFKSGFIFLFKSTRMSIVLGAMMIFTPVVYKSIKAEKIDFINPIIFGVVTFLIYISQFAPVLYAVGHMLMGRVDNIRFITAQFFILINYLNLLGFIKYKHWRFIDFKWVKAVLIGFGSLLIILCVLTYIKYPSNIQRIYSEYKTGKIETFIEEQNERIRILEDDNIKEVIFKPLTYKSIIFGKDQIEKDKESGRNKNLAKFYDKTFVYVEE